MPHVIQRPSGHIYRMVVPPDLRTLVGKGEIRDLYPLVDAIIEARKVVDHIDYGIDLEHLKRSKFVGN